MMKNAIGTVLLSIGLIGCGGGGGGGGGDDLPSTRAEGSAGGLVAHGRLSGATISGYSWNGTRGNFLGNDVTNSEGRYLINVNVASTDVEMTSIGGGGVYPDEATGRSVSMGNDGLRALIHYEEGKSVDVQLTYFTTLAACYAEYLVDTGVNSGQAISQANSVFSGMIGESIIGIEPIDITEDEAFTQVLTPAHKYGVAVASVSYAVEAMRVKDGAVEGSPLYSVKALTEIGCRDIRYDGLLQGIAEATPGNPSGQLYLGSTAITTAVYRRLPAVGVITLASHENNKSNLNVSQLLALANGMSQSAALPFGGVAGQPVDNEPPTITVKTTPGTLLAGEVEIEFDIQDPLGVASIDFYLDGDLYGSAQPDDQVMKINTQLFSDGDHTISVIAVDNLGNSTPIIGEAETFAYTFVNTGANVSLISDKLVNTTSYTAKGTFESVGADVADIKVNGELASLDLDKKTWEANVSLTPGNNDVNIVITDILENSNSITPIISVDLVLPSIQVWGTTAKFTNFDGNLNNCVIGDLDQTSGFNRPVCLNAEKVSLNGTPITGVLTGDGFVLLAFNIADPQASDNIFTSVRDLDVEYRYVKDNVVVVDWTPAIRTDLDQSQMYIPLVTELLGDNFFKTTLDSVHKIELSVLDMAGNKSTLPVNLKIDTLTPIIEVTTEVKKESLFSTPFESRQALNLETYRVEYTYDNESTLPYLISIESQNNHVVTQMVEGATRKNRARLKPMSSSWVIAPWIVDLETLETIYDIDAGAHYEKLYKWSLGQSVAVYPGLPEVVGFEHVATDTIEPVINEATEWSEGCDIVQGRTKSATFVHFVDGGRHNDNGTIWKNYSVDNFATFSQFGDPGTYGCVGSVTEHVSKSYNPLYRVVSYEPEYEAGYPRNEFADYSVEYAVNVTEIQVINKNLGTAIFPINGWYKIPPNTKVEIVAETDLPLILNKTDTRVEDDTNTVPYGEEILQDKSITWSMDTDLEISRAIDPGNFDNIDNLSKTVTTEGLGIQNYTMLR